MLDMHETVTRCEEHGYFFSVTTQDLYIGCPFCADDQRVGEIRRLHKRIEELELIVSGLKFDTAVGEDQG